MQRAGKWACSLSFAIHFAAIVALYLATKETRESIGEMAVGTVEFDQPANVQLSAPAPRELPAVTALPMDAVAAEVGTFDAIVPVAAIETTPTVTQIPTAITQSPPIAMCGLSRPTFFGVQAQGKVHRVCDRPLG